MTNYTRFVDVGRKIIAVGRNYRDHAAELGNQVPDTPMLFMKPPSAYVIEGNPIKVPKGCKDLHHEVELGVIIGRAGSAIAEKDALDHVAGYALALDMTARDFQNEAKKKGNPWILAKGFDTSCPISGFIDKQRVADPHKLDLWCKVNGKLRQKGNTSDMVFSIPTLISYISNYFSLEPGDLILTGTPAGVSQVNPGDKIEAGLDGLVTMTFTVEKGLD